jgi:hypothetical protein
MPMPITNALSPRDAQRQIEALVDGKTGGADQEQIVSILEGLDDRQRGEALRLLDGGGDRITVEEMLSDLDGDRKTRALTAIGAAQPFMRSAGTIVVSDGDDTMWPKGDNNADTRYRGARALYRALDVGKNGDDSTGDVHLVTARDGIFVQAGHAEDRSGVDVASARYGKTFSSLLGVFGLFEAQVKEKVSDIETMLDRNPSRNAILMGDTMQADPEVFRRILRNHDDRVELVLVHEVNGRACPADLAADARVVPFTTYEDLARKLNARGVISDQQLQDVDDV